MIILDTGINLSTATSLKIKYKNPAGTSGEWTGVLFETTKIKYEVSTNVLTLAGSWTLWSFVTMSDGRTASGTPVELVVYEPGT